MTRLALSRKPPRVAYVHIAKSAGTWLRTMLERNYAAEDICNFRFQPQFDKAPRESFIHKRLFCAHMTFETAMTLDADLITVLRNPFDRIVSLYSYWHEVENGPEIVKGMSFDEFLENDVPRLGQDIDNAQTWQLAFGHTTVERRAHADLSGDELLARAIVNLSNFAVIGIYEDLPMLAGALRDRFGWDNLALDKPLNPTSARRPVSSLTRDQRRRIYARTDLDLALYDHVVRLVRAGRAVGG